MVTTTVTSNENKNKKMLKTNKHYHNSNTTNSSIADATTTHVKTNKNMLSEMAHHMGYQETCHDNPLSQKALALGYAIKPKEPTIRSIPSFEDNKIFHLSCSTTKPEDQLPSFTHSNGTSDDGHDSYDEEENNNYSVISKTNSTTVHPIDYTGMMTANLLILHDQQHQQSCFKQNRKRQRTASTSTFDEKFQ